MANKLVVGLHVVLSGLPYTHSRGRKHHRASVTFQVWSTCLPSNNQGVVHAIVLTTALNQHIAQALAPHHSAGCSSVGGIPDVEDVK